MLPILAGFIAMAIGDRPALALGLVGGMTPPCAIALATLLFKDKFTKEERCRFYQFYHGSCIYHRRCNSVCSI